MRCLIDTCLDCFGLMVVVRGPCRTRPPRPGKASQARATQDETPRRRGMQASHGACPSCEAGLKGCAAFSIFQRLRCSLTKHWSYEAERARGGFECEQLCIPRIVHSCCSTNCLELVKTPHVYLRFGAHLDTHFAHSFCQFLAARSSWPSRWSRAHCPAELLSFCKLTVRGGTPPR